MKSAIVLCVLSVAVMVFARPEGGHDHYTDRYDNLNIDEILANSKLLHPYIKCILDQGKCTPDGKELKGHIKDALETYCEKCTEVQKKETRRVIGHLINKENDYWKQAVAKYDPEDKYSVKYEKDLKEITASK